MLGAAFAFAASGSALAQSVPDAGSLLRALNRTVPQMTKPPAPAQPIPPDGQTPAPASGQTVEVKDFQIRATLFPESVLKDVVRAYLGRPCTLGDLQEAAAKIGQYYRDHDRLARAYLPPQTIRDGVVAIVVLEGRLGKLSVEAADPAEARLRPEVAAGTVLAHQPEGAAVRPSALADGLAALNALAGVKASAVLESGGEEGLTDLRLRVEDTPEVTGVAQIDNAGERSVGQTRAILSSAVNDALGFGDQATLVAVKSLGSDFGRLALSAPVGYSGLALGVNGSALHYAVGAGNNVTRPDGNALTVGASATYPLYRSETAVMQAEADYDHKRLVNAAAGQTTSDNQVDVGTLGLRGSLRDTLLGGGSDSFALAAAIGRLDLTADRENLVTVDLPGPRTQGIYGKVTAAASRVAPLFEATEAAASLSGQWAAKNLDSSEKFSLGGPTAVRAYPVDEASGDEGAVVSVALRHTPIDGLELSVFLDEGIINLSVHPWPDAVRHDTYALSGTGAGIGWSPIPWLSLRATLAQRIGPNPGADAAGNDSDGRHERTRLWFQLSAAY